MSKQNVWRLPTQIKRRILILLFHHSFSIERRLNSVVHYVKDPKKLPDKPFKIVKY